MKKIDLYEIAVKLLGLYLIIAIIDQLKVILAYIPFIARQDNSTSDVDQSILFWAMCGGLIMLIVFAWLLIFRTEQIAGWITRPADTKEEIKIPADRKLIFEVCLVLLGLILIVWTLPDFIIKLRNYITFIQHDIPFRNYNPEFLIASAIKIFIGVLAIAYSAPIANLLAGKKTME